MRFATATQIGSGGSSRVLRAFDSTRGVEVALKLLHGADPDAVERLRREVAIQATLEHPHIARIHEITELDGQPCAVMPFIRGETLDRVAASLSLEARLALLLPVIDAVHAAHRVGLVHRDLKPANVLVERRDNGVLHPYVLDFGVALDARQRRMTATGQVIGTPGYLSPEQAEGRSDIDRRSDIFSLGVMLYELVADRLPFDQDSVAGALIAVLRRDPPSLQRFRRVPAALERIVMQCLEKDPALRYDSARALHADLEAFLDGRRVSARHLGLRYRLRRFVRQHPALATAGLGSVLLLTVAVGMTLQGRWQAARSAALAGEFARVAADLGRDMQLLQMRPAHDISPSRAGLRERLEPIRRALRDSDAAVRAGAAEPLGLALLALGSEDDALAQLRQLWSADSARLAEEGDCRQCALAAALGGIFEARYRAGQAHLVGIAEAELRQRESQRLEREWLQPARELLAVAQHADTEAGLLARALLAFHAGDAEQAVSMLERQAPGNSLAPLILAAELRLARVVAASGDELPADALDEAEQGFRQLIDIARSLPQARLGLCSVGELRLRQSGAAQTLETRVVQDCEAAVAVDAEDPRLRLALARAHGAIARSRAVRNEDPTEAVSAVRETLQTLPPSDDARVPFILAQALLGLAHFRRNQGEDSSTLYAEAAEFADRAVALAPGALDVMLGLAAIQLQIATRNNNEPAVFEPLYASAFDLLERIDARFPGDRSVSMRRGELLAWWGSARNLTAGDAAPLLRGAISVLQPLHAQKPDDVAVLSRLALAHWILGGFLADGGEADWESELIAAETFYGQVLALQPERYVAAFNLLSVRLQRSRQRLLAGESAATILAQVDAGLASLEAGRQNVAILRAAWRVMQVQQAQHDGGDWRALLPEAFADLEQTLRQPGERANSAAQWVYLGVLALHDSRADGEVGRLARELLQRADGFAAEFPDNGSLALHRARLATRAADLGIEFEAAARATVAEFALRHPRRYQPWASRMPLMDATALP